MKIKIKYAAVLAAAFVLYGCDREDGIGVEEIKIPDGFESAGDLFFSLITLLFSEQQDPEGRFHEAVNLWKAR